MIRPSESAPALLDRRALNRATLARQLLLRRDERSALQAIEHLAGLQAQAPNPPYIGLWTRLRDFRFDALTEHICERQVVRCAAMRSTLHLLSAADLLAFRPLLQPVHARGVQAAYGRKLAGVDLASLARAGRDLLDAQPLTSAELGRRLAERWPDHDPQALAQAARAQVALIHVPPAGTWDSHRPAVLATAAHWLGSPATEATTPEALIRRYLAAFGPASAKDISVWSGLTGLAGILKQMPDLITFSDEDGVVLFDLPEAPRPGPDVPAPPRLLPEYDNLLLAHADRRRVIADAYRAKVYTNNGIIRACVLIDGFVAGIWKLFSTDAIARVRIELFHGDVPKKDRLDLETEAMSLLMAAAPSAKTREVVFGTLSS